MKFIVEDLKGMMLTLNLVSSNRIEIEGKDLEVRIALEDVEPFDDAHQSGDTSNEPPE